MDVRYPIIINDKKIGELEVNEDGLFTVFEAECDDTGGLLRLWVHGEKSVYLGVMQPYRGKMRLKKRLSRSEMTNFPQKITYAGEKAAKPAEAEQPVSKSSSGDLVWETLINPWSLFADTATKTALRRAGTVLISRSTDRTLLALPAVTGENMPVLPPYQLNEIRRIEGKIYAVFEIKKHMDKSTGYKI